MKNLNKLFILPILIITLQVQAQNGVFIVILKGNASLNLSGSEKSINLLESNRYLLPSGSSVIMMAKSSAIVYNEKAKIEIGSLLEEKYLTYSLIESLKKMENGSITSNFFKYMNRMYAQMKLQEESKGNVVGATSRAINVLIKPVFLPADSVIILSDTLELNWGNNAITGNLLVVNETAKDTVYNQAAKGNGLLLRSLPAGLYTWTYDLSVKSKSEVHKYHNTFIIPSKERKELLMRQFSEFVKDIKNLSPEVESKLRNAYFSTNKFYVFKFREE
jgi:hypothetical protein